MSAINRARLWVWALLLATLMVAAACNSSTTEVTPDANAVRPSITGLDRQSANPGDQLIIFGINFGMTQSGGSVKLNGVDFQIVEWTDTMITVTVGDGMSSGIVVVTSSGISSQSGQAAQLFIGAAPTGPPIINAVNPDHGHVGNDIVTFTGLNFGSAQSGQVFFTAQGGAVSQGGFVEANVVMKNIGGSDVASWTNSAIDVYVPSTAASGDVFVVVFGEESNHVFFEALPGLQVVDPRIDDVTPAQGAVGDLITISGSEFGSTQRGSVVDLNGIPMGVVAWSMTEIQAAVPDGGTSGMITVSVGENSDSWDGFIVADLPQITGVSPAELRIGQSLEVLGKNFGFVQGAGVLRVGGRVVAPDSWDNGRIYVEELPTITPPDRDNVEIAVTSDVGLTSQAWKLPLVSDLVAGVTVRPVAGKANEPDGSGGFLQNGTDFSFFIEVSFGSGNYVFTLLEDYNSPENLGTSSSTSPLVHRFNLPGTYNTGMVVRDTTSGDEVVVVGPSVSVVAWDDPVIVSAGVEDFGNGAVMAPNAFCFYPDLADSSPHYFDFVIDGVTPVYTSDLTDYMVAGTPQTGKKRDLRAFRYDGDDPRPLGYRYMSGSGGAIRLEGFNFGTSGRLHLHSSMPDDPAGFVLDSQWVEDWQDEYIIFRLPSNMDRDISGFVVVEPDGAGKWYRMDFPLIASARITNVSGPAEIRLNSNLTITGHDFEPPAFGAMSGAGTYMIWWTNVTYDDEFTGLNGQSGEWLAAVPVELAFTGNSFSFNMADLGATRVIEYWNASLTDGKTGNGTLRDPSPAVPYHFFLWTGVLDPEASTLAEFANSGIFSEAFEVLVGGASGPVNNAPTAVLNATPDNGDPPLAVVLSGAGSSDPDAGDAVVQYQFDFGDGAGWETPQAGMTANYTYTADGNYTARLQVQDSNGEWSSVVTANINVGAAPTMYSMEIGIFELTEDYFPPMGDTNPPPYIPWENGGFMTLDISHQTQGFIGTITCDSPQTVGLFDANIGSINVPEGIVTITPTKAAIGTWFIPPGQTPPWSVFIVEDRTVANNTMLLFGDDANFGHN